MKGELQDFALRVELTTGAEGKHKTRAIFKHLSLNQEVTSLILPTAGAPST